MGALVSLFVEYLKSKFGTTSWVTIALVLGVSVIAAAMYTALVHVGMWETVAQVFIVAGAFYTYIIERFK